MELWAEFYERLFNFREIRYFDIEGKLTGLRSKAMTSPDGKIRIPINESADDKSQIAEYLEAYHGEGIQHIASRPTTSTARSKRCAPRRRFHVGARHLLRGRGGAAPRPRRRPRPAASVTAS